MGGRSEQRDSVLQAGHWSETGAETELLWPGAALLLLLGAVAGLCLRCSRPGAKRTDKIYEQRILQQNQQSFSVARTYSLVRQAWPGPSMDMAPDAVPTGKDKLLQFSTPLEDPASLRYQNFSKGSRRQPEAAYIDPIVVDYYNWRCSRKPPEDEDDTNSYENVLICQPLRSSPEPVGEEFEDYQNSASIHQWRESTQIREQVPSAAHLAAVRSLDEDTEEPDYVNGDVASGEA